MTVSFIYIEQQIIGWDQYTSIKLIITADITYLVTLITIPETNSSHFMLLFD